MADKIKRKSFGRLPASLRDQVVRGELPKKVDHCFALMGSFGPESRVSIETIALCMGVRPDSVRKFQRALVAAGWMVLLREGKGGGRKGEGQPREWWLNDYQNQHKLDADTRDAVAKLKLENNLGEGSFQEQGLKREGAQDKPPLEKGPESDNNNTDKNTGSVGPLRFMEAQKLFEECWQENYGGEVYVVVGKDRGQLSILIKAGIMKDIFLAKMRGYFRDGDGFVKSNKHSLSLFCSQWNRWTVVGLGAKKAEDATEGLA